MSSVQGEPENRGAQGRWEGALAYHPLRDGMLFNPIPSGFRLEGCQCSLCEGGSMSDEDNKPTGPRGERRVVINIWPAIKWLYRKLTGKKLNDEL